ncbi:MAG: hypothetical protein RLO80_07765 [Hyphomonas sp.]
MILQRLATSIRKQDWFTVLIETLIVVFGVFIGLQLGNWNEARADAQRETAYLEALHEDFGQVITELEADIARYEEIANAMTLLIEQSRMDTPDAPLDELNEAAARLISMEGTPLVSDTYANLTGSGDLALLQSQDIKNRLAAFFGQAEVIQLVSNTHEMQLVNIFQPYIVDHLDYTLMFRNDRAVPMSAGTDTGRILTALATPELRNVAAVKWDIATDIHGLLVTALEDAQELNARLAKELERRS